MKVGIVLAAVLLTGLCSAPDPLTASVTASATATAVVGASEQLVVNVTNTGPLIPHLGLEFRTADRWYATHKMTELAGCSIASDQGALDCGDLPRDDSKTYSFAGVALAAGSFHYELALRELVQPFAYVDDHTDGPDVQAWDETISAK